MAHDEGCFDGYDAWLTRSPAMPSVDYTGSLGPMHCTLEGCGWTGGVLAAFDHHKAEGCQHQIADRGGRLQHLSCCAWLEL